MGLIVATKPSCKSGMRHVLVGDLGALNVYLN